MPSSINKLFSSWGVPFLLNSLATVLCHAQTSPYTSEAAVPAPVEAVGPKVEASLGVSHQRVSNNYGNWSSQLLQLRGSVSAKDEVIATLEHAKRFRESGSLLGVQWQRELSDRWQTSIALTGTSTGTFWPASQFSAGLYSKVLSQKNLIIGGRLAHHVSRGGYRDELLEASAVWYASSKWVMQGGLQHNKSSPGSVKTSRVFGALTYGPGSTLETTLVASSGREGYQQGIGIGNVRVDFHSEEISQLLRYRISPAAALDARLVHYSNPYYKRNGVGLALVLQY